MPKIVDKSARRDEFIDVAWRIIREHGFDAVTLRGVAAAAGYSNGALKPYFATKDELLVASYMRAYERSVARSVRAIRDRRGLDALRRFCHEIMPLDHEREVEAAVVVAFWGRSLSLPGLADLFRSHEATFREQIVQHLDEARADGELTSEASNTDVVDSIMWMMMGLQAMEIFTPTRTTPRRQRAALERILAAL